MQIVGDPVGGIRKHVHSILFGLDDARFNQSYAYSTVSCDKKFRQELIEIERSFPEATIPLQIKKDLGFSDLLNIWKLKKYVKKKGVDIVHGHGAKGGAYARILKKLCGVKAIYTPHGGTVHNMFSFIPDIVYSKIEKVLYHLTDYFIFESNYTATQYHSKVGYSSCRWIVNYSGVAPVNIADIASKSKSLRYTTHLNAPLQMGLFGMLRPQKGQIYAIKAVAELANKGIIAHLHIFGEGPDRASLIAVADKLGIGSQVFFYGEVSDVEPYIYSMDLIIIPSLFESFGYVALEALLMNKFVIASNVGGLKEIILHGESGLLIPEGNPSEICKAVLFFLSNMSRKSTPNLQYHLEKFSLKTMLSNISNVYFSVLGRDPFR
ncbi:MAG: glycosyltransferase family 4 protein [Candidatus Manganitrophus sp. SA1]|nr:glycosyltransferase family 4 protein [Candidatus Manganitrophus morganii]